MKPQTVLCRSIPVPAAAARRAANRIYNWLERIHVHIGQLMRVSVEKLLRKPIAFDH
ncbi:hypothetical protein [Bradyrhizobium sp. USDA 4502]